MTASAQIGTLRGVPDRASLSLESGASPKGTSSSTSSKSNFHSVLEHASRDNASETSAPQRKQKDSEPASTVTVAPPATPPADAPRLILPFTTSITLRQDATSAPDNTATQDAAASPDDTTTPDSTAAAGQNGSPTTISPTLTILRGTLVLPSLPRVSDAKMNRATPAKSHAKSKDDPTPAQTVDAPPSEAALADPSIPIRVTSSTTSEQAGMVVQNGSTVSEPPYIASTSTSDRAIAYQNRSSNERPAEAAILNRVGQPSQKVSDSTAAVAVPAALAQQPPISAVPRQDAKVTASNSAASKDSSPASGADPKNTLPPAVGRAENTTTASNTGTLAFAARLTPTAESQAPASDSTRAAESLPGPQTPPQAATLVSVKQIATAADVPADAHNGESGGQSSKEKPSDLIAAKPDTLLPQMPAAVADQPATPANNHASASPLSAAARMDQVIEPPAAAPKTNNDITVRIPDSTGQDTAVRFVERAGEVHVSVRTGDAEMAQSLRGGLNDLVNRLEDGGIHTQVWQPGADTSTSHNNSQQPFADPDGSNGNQYSSGSNSEQESKQQNKPRWVEELEGSIGNSNFKETTQLLWQA